MESSSTRFVINRANTGSLLFMLANIGLGVLYLAEIIDTNFIRRYHFEHYAWLHLYWVATADIVFVSALTLLLMFNKFGWRFVGFLVLCLLQQLVFSLGAAAPYTGFLLAVVSVLYAINISRWRE